MTSPPPTPSSLPLTCSSAFRFKHIVSVTEWIEDYRPGELHPVNLGDRFKNGRYRVLRKLGYGAHSAVCRGGRYVVLKILTADLTVSDSETSILKAIAQSELSHPGRQHVMTMKEHFKHTGTNGEHGCLVFEPMGQSVTNVLQHLPKPLRPKTGFPQRCPIWMAKSILRQALLGLDFLHQIRIAHGDLQEGNLLFSARDLSAVGEEALSPTLLPMEEEVRCRFRTYELVERVDGKTDLWAPKFLFLSQPLTEPEFANLDQDFVIKVSDMGSAFFLDDPPEDLRTPITLRSPERFVGSVPTISDDIWAFGCLVFKSITGGAIPMVHMMGNREDTEDRYLLNLFGILGPVPLDLLSKWPRSDRYFNAEGEHLRNHVGELPEGSNLSELQSLPNLEGLFDREKPAELSDEDARQAKRILRWVFQYDISKRPSASELLEDPWFSDAVARTNGSSSS
ncbi:serine kinase protein [Rutstroemia sp. NJR-2017a BVV2]|nr:serine kinase protein [Rutstroemia sp. NJR-2017a BVV2]